MSSWRKILFSIVLSTLMVDVIGFLSARNGAEAVSSTIYIVVPNKLNIRDDASVDSFILARLKRGTLLKKVHSKRGWWLVRLKNGREGYVDPKFLAEYGTDESETPEVNLSGELYYVNSRNKVSVRSGPSSNNRVKGKLRGGTVVRLYGTIGSYGKIEVYNNGNRGYVLLSLLKKY